MPIKLVVETEGEERQEFALSMLDIQPGDVVVVTADGRMTREAQHGISAMLHDLFPENESLILEKGFELSIVRPGAGADQNSRA